MMSFLRKLIGLGPAVDYADLVGRGAQVVDVRTPGEYRSGHIKGSVNLPLQTLTSTMSRLSKSKPVITCCASGMRSASARQMLLSNGFSEVHNGGGWSSLERKIKQHR
jgi:phage shock protein E